MLELRFWILELNSVELDGWNGNWSCGTEVLSIGTQLCGTRMLNWNWCCGTEVLRVGTQFCGTRTLELNAVELKFRVLDSVLWNSNVVDEWMLWNWSSECWNSVLWNSNVCRWNWMLWNWSSDVGTQFCGTRTLELQIEELRACASHWNWKCVSVTGTESVWVSENDRNKSITVPMAISLLGPYFSEPITMTDDI